MKKIILGSAIAGIILVGCGGEDYPKETMENKYFQVCKDELTKKFGDGFKSAALSTRDYELHMCFEAKENKEKRKNNK